MKKRTPDKKKGTSKSQTSSRATEKRPGSAPPTKAVAAPMKAAAPMKKDAVVSDAPRAESRSVARSDQPTTRSSPAPEPRSTVGGWPPFRYPPR